MIVKINSKILPNDKLGVKAKNLMALNQAGFNTIDGIILDSDIYDLIVKENNLKKDIDEYLDKLKLTNKEHTSYELMKLFENIKIPSEIVNEIISSLNPQKEYRVKTSSFSSTKDHSNRENTLFITSNNINSLTTNIIKCYSSLFVAKSLELLLNNSISRNDLKMSIIIEESLNSSLIGHCKTINPLSGNDKELLIELSQSTGKFKAKYEKYLYNWYDKVPIVSKNNKFIKKPFLIKMSQIFLDIASYFGYPCDIYFIIKNEKIYITEINKIVKLEYRQFDDVWLSLPKSNNSIGTKNYLPYIWSLYEYTFNSSLKKFLTNLKIFPKSDKNKKISNIYYGNYYLNFSIVEKSKDKYNSYQKSKFNYLKLLLMQNKLLRRQNKTLRSHNIHFLNQYYQYKKNYDNKNITDIKKEWYNLIKNIYFKNESTYQLQIFINELLHHKLKNKLLKYISESEYSKLLCSIENISNLSLYNELWNLSRKIRHSKETLKYWRKNDSETIVKNLKKDKYELDKVSKLILKYGYYSDTELDITSTCYYETPAQIINIIQNMINLEDKYSPQKIKEVKLKNYQEVLSKVKASISQNKYKKINKDLNEIRKSLYRLEELKDISIRFYYIIRIYTIKLAHTLKKEKVISNIEDIYYLAISDLWSYIDGGKTKEELKDIINKNCYYYNSYRNYISENEIGNIPITPRRPLINEKNKDSNILTIKGLGVSSGVVTGKAKIIKDYQSIAKLTKNDILVIKNPDNRFIPLFPTIKGIITEYGYNMCNTATYARYYNIPAIVNCHAKINKIIDGDTITINGTTGDIIIIKNK